MSFDLGGAIALLFWAGVLFPTALAGVAGIIEAFRRERAAARRCATIAGVPALALFAWFSYEVWSNPQCLGDDWYIACLCIGLFSFAIAFWALLLAYLIPEKPRRPEGS